MRPHLPPSGPPSTGILLLPSLSLKRSPFATALCCETRAKKLLSLASRQRGRVDPLGGVLAGAALKARRCAEACGGVGLAVPLFSLVAAKCPLASTEV